MNFSILPRVRDGIFEWEGYFLPPIRILPLYQGWWEFYFFFTSTLACFEHKLGFVEEVLLAQRLFHSNSFIPPRVGDEVFKWEGDFHPPIRILPLYQG